MIEQGDNIINTEYYDKVIARANAAIDCGEVNELMAEALASMKAQQAAMLKKIEALLPMLSLLEAPTSLTAIIKWVKTFIKSFLGPYLAPYATYVAQLALLEAKLVEMIAAFEAAASRMTHCSISADVSLPSVTLPPFDTSALTDPANLGDPPPPP